MINQSENIKKEKEKFYAEVIKNLQKSGVPFLLGGTYAVIAYTGIQRETKDLDFFCKSGDYPRILQYMKEQGYETEVEDERFVAKIKKGKLYVDLIMGSFNSSAFVDDSWFEKAPIHTFLGLKVETIRPDDLIWTKIYVQQRGAYHGADINHLILKQSSHIDWRRLLMRMEQHWEILFSIILNFRFVYPSDRGVIPIWLMEELVSRLKYQITSPIPHKRTSRGKLFSDTEYAIDYNEWKYQDTFTWT